MRVIGRPEWATGAGFLTRRTLQVLCWVFSMALLAGCNGGSSSSGSAGAMAPVNNPTNASTATSPSGAPAAPPPVIAQASTSAPALAGIVPGSSPFISFVQVHGLQYQNLASVEFIIAPKPNTVSKPVDVTYTKAALQARGYVQSYALEALNTLNMPVFGLYAGYPNAVTLIFHFNDGSTSALPVTVRTQPYDDPTGIYSKPVINKARAAGSSLGFDFFAMKSGYGSPVVLDTDAEIRWVVPATEGSLSTALKGDTFYIGDGYSTTLHVLRLDGTWSSVPVNPAGDYTDFHHNLDYGKSGFLGEFDASANGVKIIESNVAEISPQGKVLKQWDIGAIISAYMASQGDDPSLFVRPGVDWFHSNAVTYDPSDDTLIVSSREDFLMKIDYNTGNIIWIFGDPTKYWYTFPSLRAKAVLLINNGLYPVGQHAVSITSQGYVMVFNDGDGSADQPAGQSPGISRTFSAVSAYTIDAKSLTATDVFDFEYGQTIYSPVCGSAYEAKGHSILVDYATADHFTQTRLVGLDGNHNVIFDFQYPTVPCVTSWNAIPMPLDAMLVSN